MYKDIEVIELDAVNNVKTGPIIRILRELIEMIVYKEPTSESSISEKYNIFIPDNNIVVFKLDELLQNINSQLILDTDSDSSDTDYDGFENDASESGTLSTVYYDSESQSQSQGSDIYENIINNVYPDYSPPPMGVSKKVTDALSKQSNTLLKKAAKRFASLDNLIGEITDRLYKLTTTNTKSGKIPPKKILPPVSKNSTVIPQDNQQPDITSISRIPTVIPQVNRQPDFIKNGEKYIWVEVVDGRDHYKKEGDNDPTTLYFSNGEDITLPDLEEVVQENDDTDYGGKRTRKVKRGKKKTRKTGNKKNKNKKRVSRVNKKRIGKKTRKNM
jgi:hypothetical protein